ncbi:MULTISPECIES: (2Fe-2S) ferredoxin domain-containing protein [Bacillaceae]|uniref:(2Fe-2S) ferredoxin domain-containing protein n=1 Tax=Bacillaceae TaxID=186817 RepID=UPI001BDF073A|nr:MULTISPECIES: (2Fe-2S) ferredoxin domain-containing protein [Bacillaceae]MDX8367326.1 (2Fe-2S) ferredoxin domain-containing protein [Cytobacillus sp. IB215665]
MTTWNLQGTKHHVLICNGSSCMRKGGEEATVAIREEIERLGLDSTVHTTRTRCNGRCKDACVAIVYPEGTWYEKVTPELGRQIVSEHLAQGKPLTHAMSYTTTNTGMQLQGDRPLGISKEKAVVNK